MKSKPWEYSHMISDSDGDKASHLDDGYEQRDYRTEGNFLDSITKKPGKGDEE